MPQSPSSQHAASVHVPSQHLLPDGHWASLVHEQAVLEHCFVTELQHCPVRQSASDRQHGSHRESVQHVPSPQSPSSQQAAWMHEPSQHFSPVPHCSSRSHGHAAAVQV